MGFDTNDDAAVYLINEETAMIQTVDIFPPVVDDPFEYGQIAAANSLSDVYAMGAAPRLCLNIFCFPEDLPKASIKAILEGGYSKVIEAGAIIAGGHTIKDKEPKYGLCVTGFTRPELVITNSKAKEGDLLILTKPLGSGILNTAAKADLITDQSKKAMISHMATLNKLAYERMLHHPVNSCTDVTGFGLFGHVHEMAMGSKKTISLRASSIPIMEQAMEMAEMGIIPAGAYSNRDFLEGLVQIDPQLPLAISDLLFDPQTSGGLLISLPEKAAFALLAELKQILPAVEIIGEVLAPRDETVLLK